ncbi:MAG: cation transporter, partial [Bdellovibrionota bacterium]
FLFILLSAGTTVASVIQLARGSHPETTLPGAIIATLSLSFMFFLWNAKVKVAEGLGSITMMKDAGCSLACIKLSVVLLAGSVAYWIVPSLWWVDSTAALCLAYLIAREGIATIRSPESACCGCGG